MRTLPSLPRLSDHTWKMVTGIDASSFDLTFATVTSGLLVTNDVAVLVARVLPRHVFTNKKYYVRLLAVGGARLALYEAADWLGTYAVDVATDVLTPTAMGTIVSRDVCELGATVAFHGGTAGTASYHVRLESAASLMLHTAKAVACQQCASSVVTAAAHGLAVNDAVRLDFSGIPAGVREKQTLTCVATSGTFTLSFGGYTTTALQWNANAATVLGAVAGLTSVVSATVTFSTGAVACAAAPGVGMIVTFTGNAGDQPPMTSDVASLQYSPQHVRQHHRL